MEEMNMPTKRRGSPSLTDRVKDHIVVLVASACVAAGAVTFTVAKFLFDRELGASVANHQAELSQFRLEQKQELASISEKYESVKGQLEARLVSIERRLGENDVFDVRRFFVSDPNNLSLSKYARYYADAGFYAPADDRRWEYLRLSEVDFAEYLMGKENPIMPLLRRPGEFTTVHVWKGIEEKLVDGGSSPFQRLFPFVSVVRVSHDDMLGVMNKMNYDMTETLVEYDEANFGSRENQETAGLLDKMYRGDSTGLLLSSNLLVSTVINSMFPGTSYYIRRLQKIDNVVYCQSLTTLTNVRIDGVHHDAYFVTAENIMISTPEAMYLINTVVPSSEPIPRNEYFVWITEWLGDFAVLIK